MKIDVSMVNQAGSMSGLLKMLENFKTQGLLRDDIGEVPTLRDVQNVVREYGEKETPYGRLATRPEIYPIYVSRERPMILFRVAIRSITPCQFVAVVVGGPEQVLPRNRPAPLYPPMRVGIFSLHYLPTFQ